MGRDDFGDNDVWEGVGFVSVSEAISSEADNLMETAFSRIVELRGLELRCTHMIFLFFIFYRFANCEMFREIVLGSQDCEYNVVPLFGYTIYTM